MERHNFFVNFVDDFEAKIISIKDSLIPGYLGLTLGVSLHDVNNVISSITQRSYL